MNAAGVARSARAAMAPGGCKTRAVIPQPAGGCVPLPRRRQCYQRGAAIPRHLFPNARFLFGARSLSNDPEAARRPCFFLLLSFRHHSNGGLATNLADRFHPIRGGFHMLPRL